MKKLLFILTIGVAQVGFGQDTIVSSSPDFFEIDSIGLYKFKSDKYANWYLSSNKKTKLYFVPYTDYSITTAIITNEKSLPKDIASLLKFEGVKIDNYEGVIEIDSIKSNKGVVLGITKKELINLYNSPDSISGEIERQSLHWTFKMLENDSQKVGGLKPFILEGLKFSVEATFLDNRLVTIIYRYEVP